MDGGYDENGGVRYIQYNPVLGVYKAHIWIRICYNNLSIEYNMSLLYSIYPFHNMPVH